MPYASRLNNFQDGLAGRADAAFLAISADLQYLTGIPRSTPNFGATIHPGAWLEGAWIAPGQETVLTLSRMTAIFGGLQAIGGLQTRILGDWDDPAALVRAILRPFHLPAKPRLAITDHTPAETIIALQAILPDVSFVSATEILRPQRVIKSEDEIAIMRRAGEMTEAAFADVLKQLKHGMTELDVVAEVHYQLWRHGSPGSSFTPLLENSGPNHPLVFGQPLDTWKRQILPPVSVLFDFGAIYDGYCYDFGRTVFFGDPAGEAQRVYDLVMAAQQAGIAALRAGQATTSGVDATARKVIGDAGYGDYFLHRLGHGIGLDVHEPPFLTTGDETPLREGMLFTIEPSIMVDGGFSARVEDIVVARPGGGEPLTSGFQQLYVVG